MLLSVCSQSTGLPGRSLCAQKLKPEISSEPLGLDLLEFVTISTASTAGAATGPAVLLKIVSPILINEKWCKK